MVEYIFYYLNNSKIQRCSIKTIAINRSMWISTMADGQNRMKVLKSRGQVDMEMIWKEGQNLYQKHGLSKEVERDRSQMTIP